MALALGVVMYKFLAVGVLSVGALVSGCAGGASAEPAPEPRARVSWAAQDWTPEPQPELSREAAIGERALTLEQWRAIRHIAPERQVAMARIAWCESRWDAGAVGDGGRSRGAWQVQERFWGTVPDTLEEQAIQAERIAAEHGLDPWSTAGGCEGWR